VAGLYRNRRAYRAPFPERNIPYGCVRPRKRCGAGCKTPALRLYTSFWSMGSLLSPLLHSGRGTASHVICHQTSLRYYRMSGFSKYSRLHFVGVSSVAPVASRAFNRRSVCEGFIFKQALFKAKIAGLLLYSRKFLVCNSYSTGCPIGRRPRVYPVAIIMTRNNWRSQSKFVGKSAIWISTARIDHRWS